ncbi:o-succinylbenzoate synthase [Microlunatus sp. Gsoil 973]|uniref:o-succinylbenzoate synthase n=1 Tax=Microlunatus sp. Gsoil 973 TaxID=2672569 RepID=UPI0012B4A781|nr:o-succinylbenzoate synthase [Microlunatus sp. Gsoil 973]QGN32279.1 o-succinylbenzoate synthase [Microlunatus sp. Gsoil 973]
MQVVRARMHRVRQALVHEFRTSSHQKSYLEHLLIELHDADGAVGWGEIASPSGPFYCAETTDSCWLVAKDFILPSLIGKDWDHPVEAAALWSKIRGNEFAKAGVDVAVWALWTTATGVPLATALGGTRTEVVAGVSLGIEPTIDDLLQQVRLQTAAGYPRVKLKIAPGWDVDLVKAVRAEFGDLDLHVDANGSYTESENHLSALTTLDDFGLTMIEQPFAPRNLMAHARMQQRIGTPICLDESVETLDDLHTAIELSACRILNIKVSRMGGLTPARAAHDLARDHDIPVWCGGMHEFGIGRAANVAISALPGFSLPSDVSASAKYYQRDIIVPEVVADRGVVTVPTGHGLGHRIDEELIAELTLDSVEL